MPHWFAYSVEPFLSIPVILCIGAISMNRRQFSITAASTLSLGLLAHTGSFAQITKPRSGVDYLSLDKPVVVESAAGKVEVIEFFGYWCPHCNAFEPELEAWLKRLPANISFRRVPVAFNEAAV